MIQTKKIFPQNVLKIHHRRKVESIEFVSYPVTGELFMSGKIDVREIDALVDAQNGRITPSMAHSYLFTWSPII